MSEKLVEKAREKRKEVILKLRDDIMAQVEHCFCNCGTSREYKSDIAKYDLTVSEVDLITKAIDITGFNSSVVRSAGLGGPSYISIIVQLPEQKE